MVVNSTSVLRGTSLRWCLRRNSFPSYETAALTWTGFPKSELCKMGRHWTRHPTPSMRHSSLPNTSRDGCQPHPPILTHSVRSPIFAVSWLSYASASEMNLQRYPLHLAQANRALHHSPNQSNVPCWGLVHLHHLLHSIQFAFLPSTHVQHLAH